MFIQFKAKGILVLLYAVVPIVVILILTSVIDAYCFNDKMQKQVYGIAASIAIVISGFWTYYTSDDYYIDEEGEKQYMYFDNQFMFIEMCR